MKFYQAFFIAIVIGGGSTFAQDLQIPESAVFDSTSCRYFVSDYRAGSIIQIDSSGKRSFFKTGLSKPLGMVICGNTLFVVENPRKIGGYDITDGTAILELEIAEAKFLNDITNNESGLLYVTDTNAKAVFKVDISSGTYSLLVRTGSDSPNGIVYDKVHNRLLVCYFTAKAPIDEIRLEDSTISTLVMTGLDNLDGLTLDGSGNCYVSSWGSGSFAAGFKKEGTIYRYDNRFSKPPVVVSTGYHGPADIYFNRNKHELVIPLFLEKRVEFHSLATQ